MYYEGKYNSGENHMEEVEIKRIQIACLSSILANHKKRSHYEDATYEKSQEGENDLKKRRIFNIAQRE